MKIPVFKPDVKNLDTLRQQLISYQDAVNAALASIGYDYAQRISFDFYPENFPKQVSHKLPRPVWGLKPLYLRNLSDDSAYPTDGMFVDWIPESGGIKIRGINGLLSGNLYHIELMAFA